MLHSQRAVLRILRDPRSRTGVSAAILLRHIKPNRWAKNGAYKIAAADFHASFKMTFDGREIRPHVKVVIEAPINQFMQRIILQKKKTERALARAPMLT